MGAEGIEPPTSALEADIIPFNHAPNNIIKNKQVLKVLM